MVAPSVTLLPGPVVRVADFDAAGAPGHHEIVPLSAALAGVLTDEFDGAVASLGIAADVLLLAALGRAVERTLGASCIGVDIADGVFAGGPVVLRCASPREVDATATLLETDRVLAQGALPGGLVPDAEIALAPAGTAPVQLSATRALHLRATRLNGILRLEWWYDSRRFDSYTVEELAEQFTLALIELTSEAVAPLHGSDTSATSLAFAG